MDRNNKNGNSRFNNEGSGRVRPNGSQNNNPEMRFGQKDVLRGATSRYRRRRVSRSGIAVILCTVLFLSVIAASGWHISKRLIKEAAERLNYEEPTVFAPEDKTPPPELFDKINVDNSEAVKGDLILVNYEYPYVFPESEEHLLNIYNNKTENYGVSYSNYLLDGDVLAILNSVTGELYEKTGDKCVLIRSAYRSLADQQSIYDSYLNDPNYGEAYVNEYVATPGYSEHHTGMAFDINICLADGSYVLVRDYENLKTLSSILVSNGFVQRYEEAKYPITKIKNEPWHYRYVGVPHSYVMTKEHFCLEEYIEYLHALSEGKIPEETENTQDYENGTMLWLNALGEIETCTEDNLPVEGYLIYYVKKSEGAATELKIPKNAKSYTVSGDNAGGFIVTVTLSDLTLPELATLP